MDDAGKASEPTGAPQGRTEERAQTNDGAEDLRRAADELAERLPAGLQPLARVAYNYRWSWAPGGHELFSAIDAERFERCARNPVALLQEASARALRAAAADADLVRRAAELAALIESERAAAPSSATDGPTPQRPVAFLCAEYGVHVSLPVYSGGLGALAGDLLKEASDQRVPLVAAGLMYRRGYFRQRLDATGWQHEYWTDSDPARLPAALVSDADGGPLKISVTVADRPVRAQIWRVDVGRVPLYLLDSDLPENDPLDRFITARLYDADPDTRLAQYLLLGVGCMRALRAMGVEPWAVHLNEGHAALAPIELALGALAAEGGSEGPALRALAGEGGSEGPALRALAGEGGSEGASVGHGGDGLGVRADGDATRALAAALDAARARTLFTTHTPVAAGNDSYPAELVRRALAGLAAEARVDVERLLDLGRRQPGNSEEPFGVTEVALRTTRHANAVSRRHGEVARAMWQPLWPQLPAAQVPISHVTNGVHVPTWIGAPMRALLDRTLGTGWDRRAADPATWEAVSAISDEELWRVRRAQREDLVALVRERSVPERLLRGDLRDYARAAAEGFDPDVLTVGFARRVATYKRLHLLVRDPDAVLALLGGERPVQVVLAGKAHPRDDDAKRVLQGLFQLKWSHLVAARVVFLEDYDLASAATLVRGCDVWLNLPRPPLEASGTSGMKSAFNGGLQVSVRDGWWDEAPADSGGWSLPGDVLEDHGAQDDRDAELLHRLLCEEVVPCFYDRDERGLPRAWLARIRASLRAIGPRFSATRMLHEYVEGPYRRQSAQMGLDLGQLACAEPR
jgi:starch phosphorylase